MNSAATESAKTLGSASLQDQIRWALEDDLRNGRLLPGMAINEPALCTTSNANSLGRDNFETASAAALTDAGLHELLRRLCRRGHSILLQDLSELSRELSASGRTLCEHLAAFG